MKYSNVKTRNNQRPAAYNRLNLSLNICIYLTNSTGSNIRSMHASAGHSLSKLKQLQTQTPASVTCTQIHGCRETYMTNSTTVYNKTTNYMNCRRHLWLPDVFIWCLTFSCFLLEFSRFAMHILHHSVRHSARSMTERLTAVSY